MPDVIANNGCTLGSDVHACCSGAASFAWDLPAHRTGLSQESKGHPPKSAQTVKWKQSRGSAFQIPPVSALEVFVPRKTRGELTMRNSISFIFALAGTLGTAAFAADREIKVEDRLDASAETLADMMRAADKGIPQDLLDKAKCVVVVPGMKKAGFILGAKFGRGFAVCRHSGGTGWTAPAAVRVEGGSVGFQIGASETDVVLLVTNDGGMKHLLSDKFTI